MKLIPSGAQTYSKMPERYPAGVPQHVDAGSGAYVYANGQKWLDYVAGLGSVILGHGAVNEAIHYQMLRAINLPLPSPLEAEVAQLIVDMVPSIQSVRFCKNGADATAAAVRIARAATGRDRVLTCGYHGYQDWCQVLSEQNAGIPAQQQVMCSTGEVESTEKFRVGWWQHVMAFPFNDLSRLEEDLRGDTSWSRKGHLPAAVIVEPVLTDGTMPDLGYLQSVRELCDEHGALLIFDEVITGFRMAVGGAQQVFHVEPDLTCLGKAMGNGMPLAAVCGKWEYMRRLEEDVFFSTTFAGELLSLAAAKACLTVIRDQDVPAQLRTKGNQLVTSFNRLVVQLALEDEAEVWGYPQRLVFRFREQEAARIFGEKLVEHRILYQGYHNLMMAHSPEDLDKTVDAYEAGLKAVKEALVRG